ncbi:MAG: hypothetical protein V4574_16960 [Pseudomonadota bacterium]
MGALLPLVLLPIALSVAPAPGGQDLSRVASIATMQGSCTRLVVPGGGDQTSRCTGKLLNIAYRDNRSSFRVAMGDILLLGFYGDDQAAVGDSAVLVVRKIIITRLGSNKTDTLDAVGECRYTNPYAGPSHVDCKASRPGEVYEFSFVSDGKPPAVTRF